MNLTVNGEPRAFPPLADLAAPISQLGLDGRKVAIERNLDILPRAKWSETRLEPGDRYEIVHFVGGG